MLYFTTKPSYTFFKFYSSSSIQYLQETHLLKLTLGTQGWKSPQSCPVQNFETRSKRCFSHCFSKLLVEGSRSSLLSRKQYFLIPEVTVFPHIDLKLPLLQISSCPPLSTMKETGKRGMRRSASTDIKRKIVSQTGMSQRKVKQLCANKIKQSIKREKIVHFWYHLSDLLK